MLAPSLKQEAEQLVLEQIRTFAQPEKLNDRDIFECHLRHYRIAELYREIDHIKAEGARLGDIHAELASLSRKKSSGKRPSPEN